MLSIKITNRIFLFSAKLFPRKNVIKSFILFCNVIETILTFNIWVNRNVFEKIQFHNKHTSVKITYNNSIKTGGITPSQGIIKVSKISQFFFI